jgi:enoyl-CoA hydratase/carnithine racemase
MNEVASGKLILDRPAEAVARITIRNPSKRNALDHEILDGIATLMEELDEGISTRCVVITGSEGMFSAGYDIGDIPDEVFAEEAERLVAHPFSRAIEAVEAFPFPTLAAINGHALGGGLELALTCDLRIASEGAKLGMPPAKLGLIYSHTGLQKFIDAVGAARTREAAVALAAEIAANAPVSLRGNKEIIDRLVRFPRLTETEEQDVINLRLSSFRTRDFREGVRAFGEKRKPTWEGR